MYIVDTLNVVSKIGELNNSINGNKTVMLIDKYPCLLSIVDGMDHIDWWNSLDTDLMFDVGSLAFHFYFITANTRWACRFGDTFDKLSIRQKSIIKKLFKMKNDKYYPFNLLYIL